MTLTQTTQTKTAAFRLFLSSVKCQLEDNMRIAVHFNFAIEVNGQKVMSKGSWRRIVRKVAGRDNETCQYCGKMAPNGHADHVIPLSRGGTDNLENLAWSCPPCNLSKGDSTLQEWRTRQEKEQNADLRQEIESDQAAQEMTALEKERARLQQERQEQERQEQEQQAKILELSAQGMTPTRITRTVFGYSNGRSVELVRAVIAEHDLDGDETGDDDNGYDPGIG